MSSDNEINNIARMIEYVKTNEIRMAEQATTINKCIQANQALNDRVTELMRQMQMMSLIGRDSGATVPVG